MQTFHSFLSRKLHVNCLNTNSLEYLRFFSGAIVPVGVVSPFPMLHVVVSYFKKLTDVTLNFFKCKYYSISPQAIVLERLLQSTKVAIDANAIWS